MAITFPLDLTEYSANALGAWFATRTRGVYSAEENGAVTPGGGLSVTVSPVLAWLKASKYWGVVFLEENAQALTHDIADGSLSRIDVICIRVNKNANTGELVIKKGTPATNPQIPVIVQDGVAYDEIYLSANTIRAGALEILASDIQDLRLNEAYCGLMRDGVTGIPSQALYDQFTADSRVVIQQIVDFYATIQDENFMHPNGVYVDLETEDKTPIGAINELNSGKESAADSTDHAIYISPTGNDDTGDGSEGNPFLTLQKAYDSIEKHWYGACRIWVMPGTNTIGATTFDRSLNLKQLIIWGTATDNTSCRFNGYLNIFNQKQPVYLRYLYLQPEADPATQTIISLQYDRNVRIVDCTLRGAIASAGKSSYHCVDADLCELVSVLNCSISRATDGIRFRMTNGVVTTCTIGSTITTGVSARDGAMVTAYNTTDSPNNAAYPWVKSGGGVLAANGAWQ